MTSDVSLWSFIANAGPVVKLVITILFLASIASWTMIIQRIMMFRKIRQATKQFEDIFWAGGEISEVTERLQHDNDSGIARIFQAGLKEFTRLKKQPGITPEAIMEGTQRAMRVCEGRELDQLENNLSLLATIGSVSPYVGLFGTVWGIMASFRALGTVQQATISMVAPGISEALIATAIGLFAAIPAVIAYNRFNSSLENLSNRYFHFQEEFSNILHRQAYQNETAQEV